MNTKPEFHQLPASVQERILWDVELDYCTYEDSKANTIYLILCGSHCSGVNNSAINNYYKALDINQVERYLIDALEESDRVIKTAKELLKN